MEKKLNVVKSVPINFTNRSLIKTPVQDATTIPFENNAKYVRYDTRYQTEVERIC